MIDWQKLEASVTMLRPTFGKRENAPQAAIVLGSGLGFDETTMNVLATVGYGEIPALGASTVSGHKGALSLVELNDKRMLIYQGRRHSYENHGADLTPVVAPAYIARALGARRIVLTNSAGGLTKKAGEFVVIRDHINQTGWTPLKGPHNELWGPRFPDQSAVWCPRLRSLVTESMLAAGVQPSEGVYVGVNGPEYETPAEVLMFRMLGGDLIGMSTVPEAIFANGGGMEVGGLSYVANVACGLTDVPLLHAEVLASAQEGAPKFRRFVTELLKRI